MWEKAWKSFVGLYYFDKQIASFKFDLSKKVPPGPINEDILKNQDQFYCMKGKEEGMYDIVLKDQLNERVHYKIIHKDKWDFFYSRYGGIQLMRNMYKMSQYSSWYKAEVYFKEVIYI